VSPYRPDPAHGAARLFRPLGAAALLVLSATPASAAGAQISLSIGILAQLSGLNDVTFTSVPPETDAVNSQNVCAWTNALSGGYSVLAAGSGTGSAFTLTSTDGTGKTVAYTVGWAGTSGAGSTTALSANTASGSFTTSALVPGCTTLGPTSSATLRITIRSANLLTMTGSVPYTGSLTLTISPM
jgi:hypothetical protein